MKKRSSSSEASPFKSLIEELDFLRKSLRETTAAFCARIEGEIAQVREAVEAEGARKKVAAGRITDVRDMLTVLRTLEAKPEKGRRRDLKKFESAVEELRGFVEGW